MTNDETERIWAAGFFASGGRIKARDGALLLILSRKDRRSLDRFRAAIGTGEVSQSRTGNYRYYANHSAAESVLEALWPWLGEEKRESARSARENIELERNSDLSDGL